MGFFSQIVSESRRSSVVRPETSLFQVDVPCAMAVDQSIQESPADARPVRGLAEPATAPNTIFSELPQSNLHTTQTRSSATPEQSPDNWSQNPRPKYPQAHSPQSQKNRSPRVESVLSNPSVAAESPRPAGVHNLPHENLSRPLPGTSEISVGSAAIPVCAAPVETAAFAKSGAGVKKLSPAPVKRASQKTHPKAHTIDTAGAVESEQPHIPQAIVENSQGLQPEINRSDKSENSSPFCSVPQPQQSTATMPAAENRRTMQSQITASAPQVRIGQINVVVEGKDKRHPAVAVNHQDNASRLFLRGL
jgi:hypothetical protein